MCAAAPSCTSNLCNAAFLLIFVKGFRYYNRAYTTEAGVAGLVLCQSTNHSAGGILHNSRHRKGLICTATQVRLLWNNLANCLHTIVSLAQDLCHRTENRNPITPPLHVAAAGKYEPAVDIEPAPPQILSIVTCTLVNSQVLQSSQYSCCLYIHTWILSSVSIDKAFQWSHHDTHALLVKCQWRNQLMLLI